MDLGTILAVVVVVVFLGYPVYCALFAARREPTMARMNNYVRR